MHGLSRSSDIQIYPTVSFKYKTVLVYEESDMKACRSCGSEKLEMVLNLGGQPWGNDFIKIEEKVVAETYPLRLFFCHSCAMVQIDYTVAKEKMFVEHSYMSGTTKSLKRHFEAVGKSIVGKFDMTGSRILDIGGNDGTFLEYFADQGLDVLNVESGCNQSKASLGKGIETRNCFFNLESAVDIKETYGLMRVIHGAGVLFHLEELHSAFRGIELLLEGNGVLVAEFIYLPRMIVNCAYDQIYHEHLLYYSLYSFQGLLAQFGLEIFDAYLTTIHGGSCVAYVARKGVYKNTSRLDHLLNEEKQNGFDKIEVYKKFADNVKTRKKVLQQLISDIKSSGKTIHALGAPVKGSTILNFCGLDERHIDCAVEINPHKFGTYIPGTKIPVVDEAKAEKPDIYLLLAWNFAEEILPRFENFRAGGGQFLVPIPMPRLI